MKEGRRKSGTGAEGQFTCLKSESRVYLVAVFCRHTLYSVHSEVLNICDCVRLADLKGSGSEGVRVGS